MPQFIKIDVEGFEKEALSGLTRAPKFLSFEFNSEFAGVAAICVGSRCFCSESFSNIVFENATEFEFDFWATRDEILCFLKGDDFTRRRTYSDIYVWGK
jgi:hypothetical protein